MSEKSHVGMYSCYFCGEPMGVLLDRRLKNTLPRNCGAINLDPCNKCKGWMEKGIICISISDDTKPEDMQGPLPNPYRTGGWVVVKVEAFEKMVTDGPMKKFSLKHRFAFISDKAWHAIGLPRGGAA